ncbi:MAG: hypothetical protein AB7S26_34175 [Sandaracinaceae bacterium]
MRSLSLRESRLIVAAMAALGCGAPAGSSTPSSHDAAPIQPAAIPLDLERARLALDGTVATSREWPELAEAHPCILVFSEAREYAFDCVASHTPGAAPVDHVRDVRAWDDSLHIAGRVLPYEQIAGSWVGRAFVYTEADPRTEFAREQAVFAMQSLSSLVAHHPAFDESTTTEEWASIFVHEHFHTAQLAHPSVQAAFARTLAGGASVDSLDHRTLAAFAAERPVLRAKLDREHETLAAALRRAELSPEDARSALCAWHRLRAERVRDHADELRSATALDLDTFEALQLFLEGTARYVETRYLVRGTSSVAPSDDPSFHAFETFAGQSFAELERTHPYLTGLGSSYVYNLGSLVAMLLDHAQPGWRSEVFEHEGWLVGLAGSTCEEPAG